MESEKLQILKMVESGKLSAEQGAELIKALDDANSSNRDEGVMRLIGRKPETRWIRIKVFVPEDNTSVNVNLPISLVDVGLKIAKKYAADKMPEDFDLEQIAEVIKSGAEGKIVEIQNEEGLKVEITIE
ncbi:intein N-terminal splicing region [Caldanaerobius fijiensis DSM 17918]|uniref:Intein N-terminal splicing region n=1 Tax=Caldanaerobius fijiensis DSM 17918 TaxID=1121256 RepID=A0A1M4WM61_9THEO|nr:hypothetical protein [Caldanaerobius fijiensis]SHE82277.1 intein N-terminal splicing region [Caldanaerobius fijiensis DSM 17918]